LWPQSICACSPGAVSNRTNARIFSQLMIRLDLAIAKAFVDDIFTVEVNVPPKNK
jgi:hypothetical protein